MTPLRVLAFAAASGRVGSVFFVGDELIDWHISDKAARDETEAAAHAKSLILDLRPDVVVTEEPEGARKKGSRTLRLIAAISHTAQESHLLDVAVPRAHLYPNKYAEAEALVARYPELAPWQPQKRRFFDNEPRNTVLFEALALALAMGVRGRDETPTPRTSEGML